MIKNIYCRKFDYVFPEISPRFTRLESSDNVANGVISKTSEMKIVDNSELLGHLSSSDFSLSNLIAVGAFDRLKTTYVSSMSDMNIADKFESLNFGPNEAE